MEYEIISNIASVWFFKNKSEVKLQDTTLELEFIHPSKANTMESWKILCAISDLTNYGLTWNPHYCETTIKKSTVTTCKCYKTGTFSILLINEPSMVIYIALYQYVNIFLMGFFFIILFSYTAIPINLNSTSYSLDVLYVY